MTNQYHFISLGKSTLPNIVCLGGYRDKSSLFLPLGNILKSQFHLTSVDLPMTYDQSQNQYSLDELTEFLYQFLLHQKIKTFTLIGFSMGGLTAISFAKKYPQMVKHLILLNSTPKFILKPTTRFLYQEIKPWLLRPKFFKAYTKFASKYLFYRSQNNNLLTKKQLYYSKNAKHPVHCTLFNLVDSDLTKNFNQLKIPKTIVLFKDDTILKFKRYYPYLKKLKSKIIIFESGGHAALPGYWPQVASVVNN